MSVKSEALRSLADQITCPLSQEIMEDPVRISCPEEHSFDRTWIQLSFEKSDLCPVCRGKVKDKILKINRDLAGVVSVYKAMEKSASSLEGRVQSATSSIPPVPHLQEGSPSHIPALTPIFIPSSPSLIPAPLDSQSSLLDPAFAPSAPPLTPRDEAKPIEIHPQLEEAFSRLFATGRKIKESSEKLKNQVSDFYESLAGKGDTPFHHALFAEDFARAEELIKEDPDLPRKTYGQLEKTMVQWLIEKRKINSAKWLIQKDVALLSWHPITFGKPASFYAAAEGQLEFLKWAYFKDRSIVKARISGKNLLHEACRENHLEVAAWLIKKSPNLMTQTGEKDGNTPLHDAAESADLKTVQWLVEKDDTLLTIKNINGKTPLDLASDQGREDITSWFASRIVDKEEEAPSLSPTLASTHPLEFHPKAKSEKVTESVASVLKVQSKSRPQTFNLKALIGTYEPALHRPYLMGKLNGKKWNDFHFAVIFERIDVLEKLYRQNPSIIQMRDDEELTLLMLAAKWGKTSEAGKWLHMQDPALIDQTIEKRGLFGSLFSGFSSTGLPPGSTTLHFAAVNVHHNPEFFDWLVRTKPSLTRMANEQGVIPQTPLQVFI